MNKNINNFIQQNSPDGGFLQSDGWRKFQESVGRKTYAISKDNFHANIIEHALPVVGKYFYVPRGPVVSEQESESGKHYDKLIGLARKEKAGWIRIEPATFEILDQIKSNIFLRTVKSPHDVQPKELFIINIDKPEEQLLAEMKSKTRYNIRLSEKHGILVKSYQGTENSEYIQEFIRLTQIMAKRQGILAHPGSYYKKMLEVIPSNMLKLYTAEYKGKTIAANIVAFFGGMATYLHGASDDNFRNVMAPFLLQWQQIKDAKAMGFSRYDFGGVKINSTEGKSWAGVTRFKMGFSPNTRPIEFPGCYDIIISPARYWLYRNIQKIKNLWK